MNSFRVDGIIDGNEVRALMGLSHLLKKLPESGSPLSSVLNREQMDLVSEATVLMSDLDAFTDATIEINGEKAGQLAATFTSASHSLRVKEDAWFKKFGLEKELTVATMDALAQDLEVGASNGRKITITALPAAYYDVGNVDQAIALLKKFGVQMNTVDASDLFHGEVKKVYQGSSDKLVVIYPEMHGEVAIHQNEYDSVSALSLRLFFHETGGRNFFGEVDQSRFAALRSAACLKIKEEKYYRPAIDFMCKDPSKRMHGVATEQNAIDYKALKRFVGQNWMAGQIKWHAHIAERSRQYVRQVQVAFEMGTERVGAFFLGSNHLSTVQDALEGSGISYIVVYPEAYIDKVDHWRGLTYWPTVWFRQWLDKRDMPKEP